MFNWLFDLFGRDKAFDGPFKYIVSVKGIDVDEFESDDAAEDFIRARFEEIDATKKGGRGFGTRQGTGKAARVAAFRSQFRIRKVCTTCGQRPGFCGQC